MAWPHQSAADGMSRSAPIDVFDSINVFDRLSCARARPCGLLQRFAGDLAIQSDREPAEQTPDRTGFSSGRRPRGRRLVFGDNRPGATPVPIPNTAVKTRPPMILHSGKVGHRRSWASRGKARGALLFAPRRSCSPERASGLPGARSTAFDAAVRGGAPRRR
jgi:hypothetical protein